MAVVILDSIFETSYYGDSYDPESPQTPIAFAFGRDEKTMVWHENSDEEFVGKLCSESEICQWGSADVGRGKAARETRRLAMIPAGTFDYQGKFEVFDEEAFSSSTIGFMKLPVTSVKGYSGFVKQIAGALRRPPYGIFTKVKVVPDNKTLFKVIFEPIANIPDGLIPIILELRAEAQALIDFPYPPAEKIEQPKKQQRGKVSTTKVTKSRKY